MAYYRERSFWGAQPRFAVIITAYRGILIFFWKMVPNAFRWLNRMTSINIFWKKLKDPPYPFASNLESGIMWWKIQMYTIAFSVRVDLLVQTWQQDLFATMSIFLQEFFRIRLICEHFKVNGTMAHNCFIQFLLFFHWRSNSLLHKSMEGKEPVCVCTAAEQSWLLKLPTFLKKIQRECPCGQCHFGYLLETE